MGFIFSHCKFSILFLNKKQNLAKLNNCSRFFNLNPLKSLKHYAFWLTEFDKLLNRENLTDIEKRYIIDFCFERGINASKIPLEEAINHVKARLELTEMLANTTDHSKKRKLIFKFNFLTFFKVY